MMEPIIMEVRLFARPEDRVISQKGMLWIMEALCQWNLLYLSAHPQTPSLYESQVRYYFEEGAPDPWQDIPTTLSKGRGDCEDLACWRVAELRYSGVHAHPFIRWRRKGSRWIYHALCVYPDGRVEDPSLALGMRGAIVRKPVFVKPYVQNTL